jgi:exocyst complex protein 7
MIFQEPNNGGETIIGLASEITGIIHALETNLEVKAKHYKDLPLGNLFLMNNISYIVRSIGRYIQSIQPKKSEKLRFH